MNKTLESLAFSAVATRSLQRDGADEVASGSLQAGAGRQNGAKRHLYGLALLATSSAGSRFIWCLKPS